MSSFEQHVGEAHPKSGDVLAPQAGKDLAGAAASLI
jgi:hypothetical protein